MSTRTPPSSHNLQPGEMWATWMAMLPKRSNKRQSEWTLDENKVWRGSGWWEPHVGRSTPPAWWVTPVIRASRCSDVLFLADAKTASPPVHTQIFVCQFVNIIRQTWYVHIWGSVNIKRLCSRSEICTETELFRCFTSHIFSSVT